jgi:hypothetical protein
MPDVSRRYRHTGERWHRGRAPLAMLVRGRNPATGARFVRYLLTSTPACGGTTSSWPPRPVPSLMLRLPALKALYLATGRRRNRAPLARPTIWQTERTWHHEQMFFNPTPPFYHPGGAQGISREGAQRSAAITGSTEHFSAETLGRLRTGPASNWIAEVKSLHVVGAPT